MAEYRNRQNHRNEAPEPRPVTDYPSIRFGKPLNPELFSEVARQMAKQVAHVDRYANKSTQLRRFYDELVLWENRATQQVEKFEEFLPFIRMINAKAAYAEGRRLVTRDFVQLMSHTLNQVNSPETMTHCKLFWEAFMGFYKQERPE